MLNRPLVIAVGTGFTIFLLVAAIVSSLVEAYVEFSVFVGIPVGFIAGTLGLMVAYRAVGRERTRRVTSGLAGVAAFGYTVLALYAIRYLSPASRSTLDQPLILVIAVLTAVGVFARIYVGYE